MATYELAQLNIAKAQGDMDDPVMAGFADNLDRINALAESSPGFVWRLKDEASGNATSITAFMDPRMLVNLSVWESIDALKAFVYQSEHTEFLKQRQQWFQPLEKRHMVLWWVPAGHRPTVSEAMQKLVSLRRHGETEEAFTFRRPYPPADSRMTESQE